MNEILKFRRHQIDWMVIENNLDTEITAIRELDVDGGEDINWLYDLLLSTEKITFEMVVKYYTDFMIQHTTLLYYSLIEERYEVSSKIKKVVDYQREETLRMIKEHLTEDEQDEVMALIKEIDGETNILINEIITITNKKKKV